MEALAERQMDVSCVQETRWRGSGCRFFGAIGKRHKLFWMGNEAKTDGVGIFVAEKWADSVVRVDSVKSTVDYIMVRQEDKAKVRNVKVISSEECVPQHKLLDMDLWFNATKTWHRKFKPRVHVW